MGLENSMVYAEREAGVSEGKEEEFNYQLVVSYQVKRIMNLSSVVPYSTDQYACATEDIKKAYCRAVVGLEAVISPYLDEQYGTAKKNLIVTDTYEWSVELFGLLMEVLGRRGMLVGSNEGEPGGFG